MDLEDFLSPKDRFWLQVEFATRMGLLLCLLLTCIAAVALWSFGS
ncbi:hypothetical protein [Mesorhizobium marinum]